MTCSFCGRMAAVVGVRVMDFCLCGDCLEKLIAQAPARREYDWFVGFVRRGLVEPLLVDDTAEASVAALRGQEGQELARGDDNVIVFPALA